MNTRHREQLATRVEAAMQTIQVADDELDERSGQGNLEIVRGLLERCRTYCTEALALLPSADGT